MAEDSQANTKNLTFCEWLVLCRRHAATFLMCDMNSLQDMTQNKRIMKIVVVMRNDVTFEIFANG